MKSLAFAAGLASAAALLAAMPAQASTILSFANFDDLGGGPGPSFFNVANADGWIAGPNLIEIQHNDVAVLRRRARTATA